MDLTRKIIRRLLIEGLTEQAEPPAVKGNPRTVRLRNLYAWGPKVIETLDELKQGELSYHEAGSPVLVSKLSRRGAWFVIDGHHRVIEAIRRGDSTIEIVHSADVPNIEHGGGYRDMLSKMVNIADAVAGSLTEATTLMTWELEVAAEAQEAGIDLIVELDQVDPRQIETYELHQDPEKIAALRQAKDIPPIWIACGKIIDGHHRLLSRMNAPFIWAYEVDCDTYEWLRERDIPDLDIAEFLAKLNPQ